MRDISDLQETFKLYSELPDVSQTVSFADLEGAKQWIQAAEEYEHTTTVLAYQTFLRFSVQHLATLPSLPQHLALLKQLVTSTAVDAFLPVSAMAILPMQLNFSNKAGGSFGVS